MEAIIFVLFIVGCVLLGFGIAFLALTWSTLKMHRAAMHALHQELVQRNVQVRRSQP